MTECEKRRKLRKCGEPVYKDGEEEWKFCKEHGCKNCKGEIRLTKGGIAIGDGFWACGEACEKKLVAVENKKRENRLLNFNEEMISRLSALWNSDFFVDLKKLINKLVVNKILIFSYNDKFSAPIITLSSNLATFKALVTDITDNKTLNSQEKEDWKKFYEENKDEDIIKLTEKEEEFLFKLIAERKKQDDIREREREREREQNYSGYRNWTKQSPASEYYRTW